MTGYRGLTATTCAPTAHTSVTTPIPGHDRPTHVAGWRVAQVDKLFQRVGGVIKTAIDKRRAFGRWLLALSQSSLRRRGLAAGGAEC